MPGTCPPTQAHSYCRHEPEKHPLYKVFAQHLETFLQRTRTAEQQLPGHVEEELRAYLKCGILAHGFVRLRCEDCGESRAVAFSCKRRGWCPSCMGRRMVDTAARLVDEVLPEVPVRPFVLSLPFEIRYRLAWDGKLIAALLAVFLRAVNAWVSPPGSSARLQWRALRLGDLRAALRKFDKSQPALSRPFFGRPVRARR